MNRVIVNLAVVPEEAGGRSQALPQEKFGCPVYFDNVPELSGNAWDCRVLVSEYGRPISPGDTVEGIAIVFLSSDKVVPHMHKGVCFSLWEGKIIARGEVVAVE